MSDPGPPGPPGPPWPPSAQSTLDDLVRLALSEDLGAAADVTTLATVPAGATADAAVRTRADGVVAGLAALDAAWAALDGRVTVQRVVADGTAVAAGDILAHVRGPARAVLTGERTALNIVGHLCGVATLTAAYVVAAGGRCLIRDTRKTHAGMRALEKLAVRAGGGHNHRFGLSDALLVKDNHAAAAGGIDAAARAALAAADGRAVQVEVDTLGELDVVLSLGVRSVLLDNFSLQDLRWAVDRCRGAGADVFVEASGGVDLRTVGDIAATGVDAIAVGALTHSAPTLDIGLDIDLDPHIDGRG